MSAFCTISKKVLPNSRSGGLTPMSSVIFNSLSFQRGCVFGGL